VFINAKTEEITGDDVLRDDGDVIPATKNEGVNDRNNIKSNSDELLFENRVNDNISSNDLSDDNGVIDTKMKTNDELVASNLGTSLPDCTESSSVPPSFNEDCTAVNTSPTESESLRMESVREGAEATSPINGVVVDSTPSNDSSECKQNNSTSSEDNAEITEALMSTSECAPNVSSLARSSDKLETISHNEDPSSDECKVVKSAADSSDEIITQASKS